MILSTHFLSKYISCQLCLYVCMYMYIAPMHYHGHAVNSLAYGEKKWFLLPPSQALYSKTPSLEFAQYLLANKQGDLASKTMQCTQRAGDLMYVPTLW